MKNTVKLFGIIAIAAIIGFSLASCGTGYPPGGPEEATYTIAYVWVDAGDVDGLLEIESIDELIEAAMEYEKGDFASGKSLAEAAALSTLLGFPITVAEIKAEINADGWGILNTGEECDTGTSTDNCGGSNGEHILVYVIIDETKVDIEELL